MHSMQPKTLSFISALNGVGPDEYLLLFEYFRADSNREWGSSDEK